MKKVISDMDRFHQTRYGKLAFGVIELLLAYIFVSRAIDTGSLWQYVVAILLLIGGLNNLVRSVVFGSRKKSDAKGTAKKR